MFGYIYETTCIINNKKYIGQHKSTTFDPKYFGSGTLLKKALAKYGQTNFHIQLLCECANQQELNEKEIYYIAKANAVTSDEYYNVCAGGEGHSCTAWNKGISFFLATNAQLNALNAGRRLPASAKQKDTIRQLRSNCVVSEETRHKLSKNAKGRRYINNGTQNKLVYPEQVYAYLNQGWVTGRCNYTQNKPRRFSTDEQEQQWRKHISDAFRGRIWVTNNIKSKQIFPTELPTYLSKGWRRGRTINK